jgi:hypothetical protein
MVISAAPPTIAARYCRSIRRTEFRPPLIRYCGASLLCEGVGVGVCDIGVGFSDALEGVDTCDVGGGVFGECETGVRDASCGVICECEAVGV